MMIEIDTVGKICIEYIRKIEHNGRVYEQCGFAHTLDLITKLISHITYTLCYRYVKLNIMEITIKKRIGYFTCGKNELERIDEGLQNRNIDADAIISIIDSGSFLTIFYRYVV